MCRGDQEDILCVEESRRTSCEQRRTGGRLVSRGDQEDFLCAEEIRRTSCKLTLFRLLSICLVTAEDNPVITSLLISCTS